MIPYGIEPENIPDRPQSDQERIRKTGAVSPETGDPTEFARLPTMMMTAAAYKDILSFLTGAEHGDREAGGMLIGPKSHDDLVILFIPDPEARTTMASYTPTVDWLNETLKKFVGCGMNAKGLAHKHPSGCTRPSLGDLAHVQNTFTRAKNAGADHFFLPIVCDGRLYPYVVTRDEPDRVQLAKLIII